MQPLGNYVRPIIQPQGCTINPVTLPVLPRIITPAINNAIPSIVFPAKFRTMPPPIGYQAAHDQYVEFKRQLSTQAYAVGPGAEVVTVKFTMKTRIPTRKDPVQVWVCISVQKYEHQN